MRRFLGIVFGIAAWAIAALVMLAAVGAIAELLGDPEASAASVVAVVCLLAAGFAFAAAGTRLMRGPSSGRRGAIAEPGVRGLPDRPGIGRRELTFGEYLQRGRPPPRPGGWPGRDPEEYWPKPWFTKVAGVTYDNEDGSSRQRIIAKLRRHEPLLLLLECCWEMPDGREADHPVRVVTRRGEQVGWLYEVRSWEVWSEMEHGGVLGCWVERVTGGGRGRDYGCNLRIQELHPDSREAEEIRRATDRALRRLGMSDPWNRWD